MTDAHTKAPSPPSAPCGWLSDLPAFYGAQPRVVRLRLEKFVRDAGAEQVRAWDESIPWLQRECRELVDAYDAARAWTAILEYELPRESRRPDVIVLENGVVVVLELKGKAVPSQADVDQVFAYARDLRAYHRECADRPVHAVLVPSRGPAEPRDRDGVRIVGPAGVDRLLLECTRTPAPCPRERPLRAPAEPPARRARPVRAPAAAAHQAGARRHRAGDSQPTLELTRDSAALMGLSYN